MITICAMWLASRYAVALNIVIDENELAAPSTTGSPTRFERLQSGRFAKSRKGLIRSIGSGKTMVEFLSAAITVRVSR